MNQLTIFKRKRWDGGGGIGPGEVSGKQPARWRDIGASSKFLKVHDFDSGCDLNFFAFLLFLVILALVVLL